MSDSWLLVLLALRRVLDVRSGPCPLADDGNSPLEPGKVPQMTSHVSGRETWSDVQLFS